MASEYPSKVVTHERVVTHEISGRPAIKSSARPWTGHRPSDRLVVHRTDSKPLVLRPNGDLH